MNASIESCENSQLTEAIKHWAQFDPYIGLNHHVSYGGMELGGVESLSRHSYSDLSSEFMERFSDIFESEYDQTVTNFTILDFAHDVYLCQCKESKIYFIIEYLDSLISPKEDYFLEKWYESNEEEIKIDDIKGAFLLNESFKLDTDFLIVCKLENIKNSRDEIIKILLQEE